MAQIDPNQQRSRQGQNGREAQRSAPGDQAQQQSGRVAQQSEPQRGSARGGGALARGERERGSGLGAYGGGSPFSFVRRFAEDMDRLFEEFGMGGLMPSPSALLAGPERAMREWIPQLELFQEGDQLVVRADLPGMKKEDVRVELEDDLLTISGERRDERRDEREGFFRSERSYGSFQRAIRLPEGVDPSTCDARFENGVLELRMKAPEERRARQIPIRGEAETLDDENEIDPGGDGSSSS